MTSIFYIKKALGKDFKPFNQYKFTTMATSSDKDYKLLVQSNGLTGYGKVIEDPRISKFNKFLRVTHIDEIPQFYNLLKGDMTLVGVRARSIEHWSIFPKEHKSKALQFKPGLFGVQYYYENLRDLQDLINAEDEYLKKKEKTPYATDSKYYLGIMKNRTKQIYNKTLDSIIK